MSHGVYDEEELLERLEDVLRGSWLQDWMEQAACNPVNGRPAGAWWPEEEESDAHFPTRGGHHLERTDRARWTCFVCPVKAECEKYARLVKPSDGIWAGKFAEPSLVKWDRRTVSLSDSEHEFAHAPILREVTRRADDELRAQNPEPGRP